MRIISNGCFHNIDQPQTWSDYMTLICAWPLYTLLQYKVYGLHCNTHNYTHTPLKRTTLCKVLGLHTRCSHTSTQQTRSLALKLGCKQNTASTKAKKQPIGI